MPELISFTALRSPDELSPKEIDKTGIKTHSENLLSERYRGWLTLCERKEYEALNKEMENFLNSETAIKKFSQMPKDITPIIKYAEYNGFTGFDIKEFTKQIDLRKMPNEFGKEIKEDGCYNEKSPFFNLITNLNDQLLASTQVDVKVRRDFNLPRAIQTLNLLETTYLVGKDKIRLNIDKHFDKPLIIDSCIFEIDPCSRQTKKPLPILIENPNQEKEEKECRCKEKEENEDCECKCNDECVEQNPCCVKIKPYIAELFVVRDEVCKYELGDISYIKNIVKGETQERVHRNLEKEINYTETIDETKKFEEKFLEVTDKSSISKTIEDIIKDETKVHAGANYASGKKDGPGYFVEGSFDFKRNRDRTNKIVQDKSKDIIERMTSRLEQNVKTTTQLTLHKETEITNTSTLIGTTEDVSRQFYFVNQTRKAQVYSHGMRSMLDFYIPEPSELLKRLVEKQFKHKQPKKPCINIDEIGTTKDDWLDYVQCYGFSELEQPKEQPKGYWHNIPTYKKDPNDKHWSETDNIQIPEGYTATKIEMDTPKLTPRFGATHHRLRITFAGGMIQKSEGIKNQDDYFDPSDTCSARGSATLTLIGLALNKFEVSVRVWFEPDSIDNFSWQLEVHKLLMDKYQTELDEYNRALAEFKKQKENYFNKNPFILSEMMKMQLKQAAISYITCQFFDDNDALKGKVKDCGFPQMDLPETKKEGEFVRFFEQAFEWQFMNYMLYPYFWGRKCSWEDKLKEEADNYLFTRFLQAGFARITISVRPGFEEMVNCYLQTKQLWCGEEAPILGIGFLPIHQEIKESKNNYNADRKGHIKWDTSLRKDEIKLFDNLDYYSEDFDPITGNSLGTYSFDPDKAKIDLNREININCVTYRIVSIDEVDATNDVVKFTLDRDLEIDCCCGGNGKEFDEIYDERELPWSTGAIFIGAPWKYTVPTSLTWLREEGGCLPCYPIKCEE
ncbi:hypothetical protein KCTC32516_01997 [Polaribacter huanghezhanensis]|uniref:hypothetical protein n=1 Tax=Polaribacter huanghezhanensis TaxID=1354726 RepID=UPI0026474EBB|nr:hypothetical protein [Polaribacter huanghezhanensis]WKD86621.1 hypothetical protein KCTC32516_01997 [Polaribacter huanghezhanensis]